MKKLEFEIGSDEYHQLIIKEPLFQQIIESVGSISITINDDYFYALASAIISQQLSSKVARVIENRVYNYFDNEITVDKIIKAEPEAMRVLGLSYQKIKYLKSLASCIVDSSINFSHINELSDQDIIDMLIQVKGIGIWTAQMFLIFAMGRKDVFASLDLGLRNGVKKLFHNPNLSISEIESLSIGWSPHRTMASLYLWKMLD